MVFKIDKNIKYFKIKNPLESISASFSNISSIEPEIFKVKEWFQVKVTTPFRFRSSLIAVGQRTYRLTKFVDNEQVFRRQRTK